MKNAIDAILVLVVLYGTLLAWQSGRERRRLTNVYDRLARVTGDLRVTVPNKAHFLALETGDPMHYAWRIYVPPNFALAFSDKSGGSSSWWTSGEREFIARLRFRGNEQGHLE